MKQRPNSESQLRKLKQLQPQERAEIFSWAFPTGDQPAPTNSEIRTRIAAKWGISLSRDGQLSEFWPWQKRQAVLDHLGLMMSQDETELQKKFPNASREQLRDAAIIRGYAAADLMGDTELSMKVVDRDLKAIQTLTDREKFETETCERFLKWFKDEKARQIAESNSSNSEQIAALRQVYFKDVDALQQSGTVKLPD